MALLNGTFDCAATWWRSETRSNPKRMEEKGMIKPGQWRVIWKSPRLPSSPWAVHTDLPQAMRDDIRNALYNMKKDGPDAWQALTDGKASGYRLVTHKDYEAIVRMIEYNLKKRRSS
jgi:phosphonate transport system substrate-binding protein